MATPRKKSASHSTPKARKKPTTKQKKIQKSLTARTSARVSKYLSRRPHRSFRLTKRRDYKRSLRLPGYVSFTFHVIKTLWSRKKTYGLAILLFAFLTAILVGMASQDTFAQIAKALKDGSNSVLTGGIGEIWKAGLLLVAGVQGDFTQQPTEAQQIYGGLIFLLTWLVIVWLLRAQLAGNKPRLRDGIYSAGSPIISTGLVGALLAIQLLPLALAALVFDTVINTDLLSSGVLAMLFSLTGVMLIILSLYLVTSTFFALVIITLPGMYPWQAIRAASDLVVGRRLRLLYRLLWGSLVIVITWLIVMIPIVIFSTWLQTTFTSTQWIPIVPLAFVLMSTITIVFASSYVYLLYRKVVDDDAKPA